MCAGLFQQAFQDGRQFGGILLCEVGNWSDLCQEPEKQKIDKVLHDAFFAATGKRPSIHWSEDETVAAFDADLKVDRLLSLTELGHPIADWRTLERYVITGATEHGGTP